MASVRAFAGAPIAEVFQEAAAAAFQKTMLPATMRRHAFHSLRARPMQRSMSSTYHYGDIAGQRASLTTAAATSPRKAPPFPTQEPDEETTPYKKPPEYGFSTKQPPPESKVLVARVTHVAPSQTIVQATRTIDRYDKYLHKHFRSPDRYLVDDPYKILVEGDVIEFRHFSDKEYTARVAKRGGKYSCKHVLERVISPFGVPVGQRDGERRRMEEMGKMEGVEKVARETRERKGDKDVVDKMVKAGKNKNEKTVAERLATAQDLQEALDEKGVDEGTVEGRKRQVHMTRGG